MSQRLYDLQSGVSNEMSKFTDDTGLFKMVETKMDCERLQENLPQWGEWANYGK